MSKPDSPAAVRPSKRAPVPFSPKLDRRLLAYTAAASAAGVGLLALAEPAQAEVVFHAAHQKIHGRQPFSLDLNDDGIVDFMFTNIFEPVSNSQSSGTFQVKGLQSNQVAGYSNSIRRVGFAFGLIKNREIGSALSFLPPNQTDSMQHCAVGTGTNTINYSTGQFRKNTTRYVGLKFMIAGEVHYGWARFRTLRGHGAHLLPILSGYAYETLANTPLLAGQTSGTDSGVEQEASGDVVPGAGSLGQLARGALDSAPPAANPAD